MNLIVQAVADALVAGAKFYASKTTATWDDAVAQFMATHEAEAVALIQKLLASLGATPGMRASPSPSDGDVKTALKGAIPKSIK